MPPVAKAVHYLCGTPGGRGAFREFADWLIALRGDVEKGSVEAPATVPGRKTNQQVNP